MNQIATTMRQAVAAIQRNDFATAQQLAQKAALMQPNSPQILQVLGVAQSQGGRPEEGFKTLEKALSLAPQDPSLRFNVAKAAFQGRQFEKVDALARPLGHQPAALHLRALALKESGQVERAVELFEAARQSTPNDGQLLNNYGNALIEVGDNQKAIEMFQSARKLDPQSAQIAVNLGRAYTAADRFGEALSSFQEAARMAPSEGEVLFELGKFLVRFSSHDEALPILSEAARKGIKDPELFVLIGTCYSALELREEAEKSYRMAITLDPTFLRAYINLGLLLEQDNRLDDLESLVTEAEAKSLSGGDLDYLRALLLQRSGKLEEALALVANGQPTYLDEVLQDEFIGKTADRLGQSSIAFDAFARMNHAMSRRPEARGFSGKEHADFISARTAVLSKQWFESWKDVSAETDGPVPVMLGGFLRTGTTLLDTVLMSHPSVHVREEEAMIARMEDVAGDVSNLAKFGDEQVAAMRNAYYTELSRCGSIQQGSLLIDKYPLMTVRAAYIHRAFPSAKFIFALRHPCDVVLSCFMQNFRVTRAMSAFLTLENAAKLYDAVMTHWEKAREVLPLNVHTVRYEDMVIDMEAQIRPLIEFLGLDWHDALLDYRKTARDRGYIRTPSYSQVTEKLYTRSTGRWENYRKQMEPVLPVLAPWVEKFGYEPLQL